jgi:hypothetical protein
MSLLLVIFGSPSRTLIGNFRGVERDQTNPEKEWGCKMNLLKRIKVWMFHFKLLWVGDKVFEKNGEMIIPCKKCGKPILSRVHYDSDFGYNYDSECEKCQTK